MKIKHPNFDSIVKDVADPDPWLKAGWVAVQNNTPRPSATDKE